VKCAAPNLEMLGESKVEGSPAHGTDDHHACAITFWDTTMPNREAICATNRTTAGAPSRTTPLVERKIGDLDGPSGKQIADGEIVASGTSRLGAEAPSANTSRQASPVADRRGPRPTSRAIVAIARSMIVVGIGSSDARAGSRRRRRSPRGAGKPRMELAPTGEPVIF